MNPSGRAQQSFGRFVAAPLAALALTLSACSATSSTLPGSDVSTVAGTPVDGGALRVGVVGGSTKDTIDAHLPTTHPDQARVIQLFDRLFAQDTEGKPQPALAESAEGADGARTWTVTLREGIKFSDGSPITAEDVVFTFLRITDPEDPKVGAAALGDLDRDALEAVDERTVVFRFTAPFASFEDTMSQYFNGIVPVGYDPDNPVGSGPFMYDSFTPGQQSEFVKNPHYWREGEPHVDSVTIIDFPDDTARVNALLGGQVDAIDQLPLGQVQVVEANPEMKVLESQTGSWLPFTMRVDQPPFDDERVRQAFRLIVDREEMVEQVLGGRGEVGNDMYAPLDPCYPDDFPQRTQDIEAAKKLLADAGQSDLEVELVTSPVAAGLVEAAQVFAEQAKEAGVTVNVKKVDPGVFYGDDYLSWTFAQDFWFTRNYLPQTAQSGLSNSPYNETHWSDPEWTALVEKANATVDEEERCDLIREAQEIEYERGGYIIWGFPNGVDAHSAAVQGLVPDRSGIPLTSFNFRLAWLTK